MEIHIIQCDMQIQEDTRIENLRELETYLQDMTLKGFGGTDFRPVFDYVEQLRQAGELTRLKGLIYFTDGIGVYPEQSPDYDTAFIFVEDENNEYNVPSWAMKLTLEQEEIL